MKVYVVYQVGYTGKQEAEILGTFYDIEEAKKVFKRYIDDNIKEYGFVFDEQTPYTETLVCGECMVRLFGNGYQKNWDNYLEIYIQEQEVR